MKIATRAAYGELLETELYKNQNVVVLDADLGNATKSISFKKVAPDRYFDMGISEQDMMSTAAGLATCGKIPIVSTFAVFAAGRAFEQVRNSVAYPKLNVKIAATHAGITVGPDGGSHQAIEDIALMRSLPNMTVICPSDAVEAKAALMKAVEMNGPVYIRLGRAPVENIHTQDYEFDFTKGQVLREGEDVGIIATGIMVEKALQAAQELAKEGIQARVVNIAAIKPIDKELIIETAKKTNYIVTAEEHSVIGGLGSAVSEVLVQNYPVKQAMIGIKDTFGESGSPEELLEKYGLTVEAIIKAAKQNK
ncbi:transketolase family protein [Megamonas sp.]